MIRTSKNKVLSASQRGVVAIEFALVVLFAFFPLLLGIIEFGRYLYVNATIQEVTRRAAREQIVKWVDQVGAVQRNAVFQSGTTGTVSLPAGNEVSNTSVALSFFNTVNDAVNNTNPISGLSDAYDNYSHCVQQDSQCIQYVKATLQGQTGPVKYVPMIGIFSGVALFPGWSVNLNVNLPGATVIIPAESLGLPY
jgi:hypothetical protein